jgi:aminopeptidase YwaD
MRPVAALLVLFAFRVVAQDSTYARNAIRALTSEKCFGRGYLKGGLQQAEKFIVGELRRSGALPLFGDKFSQPFVHPVNTFPKTPELSINGKKLRAGYDFIPDPSSASLKGTYRLVAKDSVTFTDSQGRFVLKKKKKLTFSVGLRSGTTAIEVLSSAIDGVPATVKLSIRSRLISNFKSANIGCSIKGTGRSDSLIVFTAHYDHLGGMGKVYFPGANDNASGVSLLLDLIRHYSTHPPNHRTVFIFFAAEEAGLLGSKYFVEHPAVDLKKIRFLINLDLLGTGDDGIMVVNGAVHEKEFNALQLLNNELKLVKEVKKRGKAANSDHYWFSEAGVPCFFIYTMGGITAYHDVYDVEKTLPLTEYKDVFTLITKFVDYNWR